MKSEKKIKKATQMFITRKIIGRFVMAAGCVVLSFTNEVIAQDGEKVFKQNCGVCHKVGGGRLVGPDLLGVTTKHSEEWLMKWTKASQALVKSGDAEAKAIFDEFNGMVMPDQPLSDGDIKSIFAFIAAKNAPVAASADTSKKEAVPDASNKATPEEIERGKNIFIGSLALANGGPACISCHNVNYAGVIPGGLLAKDLTTVYSRLGGDAGLLGMLGAPPFPAMAQAYKDRPITEQEIAAITAFFNKVDRDKPNQIVAKTNPLLYGGFARAATLLVFIFVIWYRRKKYSVKKEIYDRQLKSI